MSASLPQREWTTLVLSEVVTWRNSGILWYNSIRLVISNMHTLHSIELLVFKDTLHKCHDGRFVRALDL